jgi:hypothetical protein
LGTDNASRWLGEFSQLGHGGGISNADEQDKRRWTRIRRLLLFHWRWNMPSIRFCRNGQPLKTTIYQFINNYLEIQAASV